MRPTTRRDRSTSLPAPLTRRARLAILQQSAPRRPAWHPDHRALRRPPVELRVPRLLRGTRPPALAPPPGLTRRSGVPGPRAIPASGKRPQYPADSPGTGSDPWVVALCLRDRAIGATAVHAPALAAWPDALQSAVADADCVIVDGTFWDDDEPRLTGSPHAPRQASGICRSTGRTAPRNAWNR
nr:MBL fold metallo-hydrolase [Streptomyces acidicola]